MTAFHKLSALFPLLEGEEFDALVASIRENGLREPITLFEERILDGRNRYRACRAARVEPKYQQLRGGSALAYVIDRNLKRRHLTASQRAVLAHDVKTLLADEARKRMLAGKRGDPSAQMRQGKAAEHAAKMFGVSPRYVEQADRIAVAAPALIADVRAGRKTLTEAERELRESRREAKRSENRALVQTVTPLEHVPDRYQTIVIDPPWDWGDEGDVNQFGRAKPDYATVSLADLLKLPLRDKADKNAHVYLWITNRSLPKGFVLLDAWGFRYITTLTWTKPSIGMGNYFRGSTEHVLFGIRGSLPLLRSDVGTWFSAPRPGGHSGKPEEFYALVESCSPGPWLEVYGRKARPGWVVWGEQGIAA